MLLDAVLANTELIWLATDEDKAVNLTTLTPIDRDLLTAGGIGTTVTKGHPVFAEKFPIGIDLNAVLVYLATDREVGRFRAFLQRHFELLQNLAAWTVRIVVPPWPNGLGEPYLKAAREDLAVNLTPGVMKGLRWYFAERRRLADEGSETSDLLEAHSRAGCRFEAHQRGRP